MIEHIKDLVNEAEKGGYTLGAFNIHGMESIFGVVKAAMDQKSPAIIQVSEGTVEYMGVETIVSIISNAVKSMATPVPVAIHLDHGRDIDIIYACIEAGFSSVHIDASHLPIEENISISKKVVEYAHDKGVWVQGEVGAIMGGHGVISGQISDIPIARLEEVITFVEGTGVDTIAAAIGTAHGVYDNEDILIDLLKEIKEATKIPFVLHGGSGVAEEKIIEAIDNGVNIINIGSDIKIAFSQALVKNCQANPGETDPRKLLAPSIEAVALATAKQMQLFRSAGKVKA